MDIKFTLFCDVCDMANGTEGTDVVVFFEKDSISVVWKCRYCNAVHDWKYRFGDSDED